GYADLSDYFYVWLRRSLKQSYPQLLKTILVPKKDELVSNPYRHGSKEKADTFFLEGISKAIMRMGKATPENVPMTLYYAFKQKELKKEGLISSGWEKFLEALVLNNLSIVGTWPVRTERANRLLGAKANALASSIALVCRHRDPKVKTITRGQLLRELRMRLPMALEQLHKGNIAPVDMAQASIGPGMAIFSQYPKVVEADGAPMSIRSVLQMINRVVDEVESEEEAYFDSETRFAFTWMASHGFEEGFFGDAETLAKARNISVSQAVSLGLLKSSGGRVRLLRRDELTKGWAPSKDDSITVWKSMQYLLRYLKVEGEHAAASLLDQLGEYAEYAKMLAHLATTRCAHQSRDANRVIASCDPVARPRRPQPSPLVELLMFLRGQPLERARAKTFRRTTAHTFA
ncbi:MAG: hypothetical protein AAGJ35_13145, partial [Myxococcota bacterium]